MRRPRGPGGRFLTADEIAAQKAAQINQSIPSSSNAPRGEDDDDDDDVDVDDDKFDDPLNPSVKTIPNGRDSFLPQPADPMAIIGLDYHSQLPIVHPQSIHLSQPSQPLHMGSKTPVPNGLYGEPPHSNTKGTTNSAPITLTAPYTPLQMHHVPHPHAHTRHHHPRLDAFTHGIYNPENVDLAGSANEEMRRRTEEMLQFGTAAS
ncbi:hypothetical protein AX15_007099 [Amanita polypyramis BW_CC]|nr:hypothetical protein AX15_007099 [Amanita polypyramis BW_CC]